MHSIEKGIKIHVSATQKTAQRIALAVLPLLIQSNVQHKFISNTDSIVSDDVSDKDRDPQSKKFITIYPQSAEQLDTLLEKIDSRLMFLCRRGDRFFPFGSDSIKGDMAYGYSGYVFMRYGNFQRDDKTDDRDNINEKLINYFMKDEDPFEETRAAKFTRETDTTGWEEYKI